MKCIVKTEKEDSTFHVSKTICNHGNHQILMSFIYLRPVSIASPGSLHLSGETFRQSLRITQAGVMLPYLCPILLMIPLCSEGASVVRSDASGASAVPPAPSGRSAHLQWLVQRKEEQQSGGDPNRRSFFENLLDQPLVENGKKKTTFLDALLSEPLFDNGLAKAVADTQEKSPEKINIPVSPQLGFMKSNEKWPKIFYPPTKYEILQLDGNQPPDFSFDTLEFFKHVGEKKEKNSDGNSKELASSVNKLEIIPNPMNNASLVGSVFDIIENIPSIDDLMDSTLGASPLTSNSVFDFNNRAGSHGNRDKKMVLKRNQTAPSQTLMNTHVGTQRAGLVVARNSASIGTGRKEGNRHQVEKKRVLHHLIYLFPKRLKKKPYNHLKEKQKTEQQTRTSHDYVYKQQIYGQEKNSNDLQKIFRPREQFRTQPYFKQLRYGTLFPDYSFYPLYPKSADVKFSMNNFEELSLFPQKWSHLMPQPIFNHKKSSSY